MIVYNLTCDNAHRFEGWFASPQEFNRQAAKGTVVCPVCSSSGVSRQPSAPYVKTGAGEPAAQEPAGLMEAVRKRLVEHIVRNTEDVGPQFPEEARRIHYREAPLRSIRGQASSHEVDALREEGIEVHSIPAISATPDKLH
jgi:hypothetical protein